MNYHELVSNKITQAGEFYNFFGLFVWVVEKMYETWLKKSMQRMGSLPNVASCDLKMMQCRISYDGVGSRLTAEGVTGNWSYNCKQSCKNDP